MKKRGNILTDNLAIGAITVLAIVIILIFNKDLAEVLSGFLKTLQRKIGLGI